MQRQIIIFFFLIVVLFHLTACSEDADSEDIRTSGIYAGMDVVATADDNVNIEVFLKVGGSGSNTYLNLTSGDKLTAILNDSESLTLTKHEESDGDIFYVGSFTSSVAGAENSVIKILFERSANDVSALDSVVTLPAAPSGLIADKNSFQRSTENLNLSWDTVDSSNDLLLKYEGDCIQNGSVSIVDNGSYTINAGTINDSNTQNCSVTFSLSRTVDGVLDTDFGEGGYLRAKQTRSIAVVSTP